MNLRRELITLGVRLLSERTSLIGRPDPFAELITTMFGGETHEQRVARQIDEEAQKAIDAAKRLSTNRKFKKITKDL